MPKVIEMPEVQCNESEAVLDENSNCAVAERIPCPNCGSLSRKYHVKIEDKIVFRDGIGMKARHPNSRRPFLESYQGPDRSRKTGKLMHKQRVIDRENDRYLEKVKDYDTGKVIHQCEEPLSQHVGHGDVKKKKQ